MKLRHRIPTEAYIEVAEYRIRDTGNKKRTLANFRKKQFTISHRLLIEVTKIIKMNNGRKKSQTCGSMNCNVELRGSPTRVERQLFAAGNITECEEIQLHNTAV